MRNEMEFKYLLLAVEDFVATVVINRPDKLNALSSEIFDELDTVLSNIKTDHQIKVLVITGAGEKAFVAGADIYELAKLNVTEAKLFSLKGQKVFTKIQDLGKPVIAAVNGFALGGGCELALACHIRYAANNAYFGQPEVNLGIIPGYGGTQRLTKLINTGRALELILSGDRISASEALSIGLVNKVFEKEELLDKTIEFAKKLTLKPVIALSYSLDAVLTSTEINLNSGLDYEASLFALCAGTGDFKEGTSAFLEKRKATFKGN
jgi:enoyl-CoA hydratase